MLGNYLQRAIDEIRVARSELPIFGAAGVRDFGTVQEALEALLDALQDVDRRLSSLEEKVSVDEESTTNHHSLKLEQRVRHRSKSGFFVFSHALVRPLT